MQQNCVFCKIVAGELPSATLYEDELVLAFLDIAPVNKGHALVIPKEHHESITTVPAAASARMIALAAQLGVALQRAVDADGFDLVLANGACAGQVVPHAHLHVIPRHPDDGVVLPSRTVEYASESEKAEILAAVQSRLERRFS